MKDFLRDPTVAFSLLKGLSKKDRNPFLKAFLRDMFPLKGLSKKDMNPFLKAFLRDRIIIPLKTYRNPFLKAFRDPIWQTLKQDPIVPYHCPFKKGLRKKEWNPFLKAFLRDPTVYSMFPFRKV